jgi:uncharacterized membrane protein YedE/YeeE
MTIDWIHFTPWLSLGGGILLGLASAAFILFNGRILGISGILAGLLSPRSGDVGWRIAFVLGIAAAPFVSALVLPADLIAASRIEAGYASIAIAGLLVGFGTRYGSGCTSGHGVCGLSRLSPRSLVATLTFMTLGFLWSMSFVTRFERTCMKHRISEFLVGLLFGLGLILSGMTDPSKVIGFLDIFGLWDPSLALVMGGAIAVGFFAFALAKKRTVNFLGGALHLPTRSQIDKPLVIGAVLFGAGWGLAGFCPGPALVSLASGQIKAAAFVVFMLAGMQLFEMLGRKATSAQ